MADFPLNSCIGKTNWVNPSDFGEKKKKKRKQTFLVGLLFHKTRKHLLLISAHRVLVWRGKIISDVLFLFCALSSVLCDGLLLCSGSCISVDMVVCVDWVQRSRTTQHMPPTSHFQDTFSLPHVNKCPESKFSFLEPKPRLFLQTFGELNDQILSLCFYSKTSYGVKTHHHSAKMLGNVNTNNNLCLLKVTFISIFSPWSCCITGSNCCHILICALAGGIAMFYSPDCPDLVLLRSRFCSHLVSVHQ